MNKINQCPRCNFTLHLSYVVRSLSCGNCEFVIFIEGYNKTTSPKSNTNRTKLYAFSTKKYRIVVADDETYIWPCGTALEGFPYPSANWANNITCLTIPVELNANANDEHIDKLLLLL